MVVRRGRRDRVRAAFDRFHMAASVALGAAEVRRDRAVRAHAETMAELWLRETEIGRAHV